jgi:ABC-type dipeptide/oligopeptide/nickel transport system ATPase component
MVPSLRESVPGQPAFQGCAFAPRCSFAQARCHTQAPPLLQYSAGATAQVIEGPAPLGAHLAACWEIDKVLAT